MFDPPVAPREVRFEVDGLLLAHGFVVLVISYGAHGLGIQLPRVLS